MSTAKYNKNKEGVQLCSVRSVVSQTLVLTNTCEASPPDSPFCFFRAKFAATHTQLLPYQLKMMSDYNARMRTSTKARYFMTIKLHGATEAEN